MLCWSKDLLTDCLIGFALIQTGQLANGQGGLEGRAGLVSLNVYSCQEVWKSFVHTFKWTFVDIERQGWMSVVFDGDLSFFEDVRDDFEELVHISQCQKGDNSVKPFSVFEVIFHMNQEIP